MLNKVPEITIWFWVIKVLCTTVGETAADYLNETVGLGLDDTIYVTGALLIVALAVQFRLRRYEPSVYWVAVVLLSVVGTLITDKLTDDVGVALRTTTIVFAVALVAVFAAWFAVERTLSIHSIVTARREAFYWLAILVTFALGTAAGDYASEALSLGYGTALVLFAGAIALVAAVYYGLRIDAVVAFWVAYVLTRPLGASIGDYLSQSTADGGLGLGTTVTSLVFLVAILGTVAFLTITRRDATPALETEIPWGRP